MSLSNPAGTTMSIVAHIDDDMLFQNPDIHASIDAGGGHVTVYLNAGDAGLSKDYWEDRETGAKAAYSVMAGADDWVDTVQTYSDGSNQFTVHSSHLASQPDIRLYFLRLPDATPTGQGYAVTDAPSVENLWDGDIQTITSADGQSTYTSDQLTGMLLGLMEIHQPDTIMIQDHSSDHVEYNHSDHVHGSQFAYAASQHYDQPHEILSYVDYPSRIFEANLSQQDAQENWEVFEAYAQFDDRLSTETDANGNTEFAPRYEEWTDRIYYVDNLSPANVTAQANGIPDINLVGANGPLGGLPFLLSQGNGPESASWAPIQSFDIFSSFGGNTQTYTGNENGSPWTSYGQSGEHGVGNLFGMPQSFNPYAMPELGILPDIWGGSQWADGAPAQGSAGQAEALSPEDRPFFLNGVPGIGASGSWDLFSTGPLASSASMIDPNDPSMIWGPGETVPDGFYLPDDPRSGLTGSQNTDPNGDVTIDPNTADPVDPVVTAAPDAANPDPNGVANANQSGVTADPAAAMLAELPPEELMAWLFPPLHTPTPVAPNDILPEDGMLAMDAV